MEYFLYRKGHGETRAEVICSEERLIGIGKSSLSAEWES